MCQLWFLLIAGFACATSEAAGVAVTVQDRAGAPVEDAAVYLEPISGKMPGTPPKAAAIEQRERKFMPLMSVVQTGTAINFPNNDSVRHHVYSFSQAKLFELKLYAGVPSAPIVFDKAGSVVLACNIHDKMAAYIRVVDTPWFGVTDKAGKVKVEGLPEGRYRLKVWHFAQAAPDAVAEQAIAVSGDAPAHALQLDMRPGAR